MGELFIMTSKPNSKRTIKSKAPLSKANKDINKKHKKKKKVKAPRKDNTHKIYCKRCGVIHKPHFQVQLTPKRIVNLCTLCFSWARNKKTKEIAEACKKKRNRKLQNE